MTGLGINDILAALLCLYLLSCKVVSLTENEPDTDHVLTGIAKEILEAKQGLQITSQRLNQVEKNMADLTKTINAKMFAEHTHKGFSGHKLVHLDLGGAPPKMEYILELVPFLSSLGATGLLVEYVDMFPFSGGLEILQSPIAYSMEEVVELRTKCRESDMIIIPLVQTFGHLEFVLKHQKFAYLRETKRFTNSLCPNKNDSVELVKKIVNQVIEAHPSSRWIHVGGDEVWNLKTCNVCMHDTRDKSELFLHHMLPVLTHIKSRKLSAIMWDDMMRKWDLDKLRQMEDLVEPMLWGYKPTLKGYFTPEMWKRYGTVFNKVWMASAFKGAYKPFADFTPIRDRLRNNLKYLEVMSNLPSTTTVMGIALTGWSRYDYFGTLCELLPAGIPSLAVCLKALTKGFMNENLLKQVSSDLGFQNTIDIEAESVYNVDSCNASFPGHDVYQTVCKLSGATHKLDLAKETERGWILHRHLLTNSISYFRLQFGRRMAEGCIKTMTELQTEAIQPLSEIYRNSTVQEWMADKLDNNIEDATKLKTFIEQVEKAYDHMIQQQEAVQQQLVETKEKVEESKRLEKHLPDF